MQHDCSETQQALQEVMDNPVKLQGVCLEEAAEALHGQDAEQPSVPQRPTKAMLAAASLFEAYERQILTVHGAIKARPWPGLAALQAQTACSTPADRVDVLPASAPATTELAVHLNARAAAQEMQENMEGVRTIWAMQLDAARNRLIQIELKVAIASLAVVVATVPGAPRTPTPCAGGMLSSAPLLPTPRLRLPCPGVRLLQPRALALQPECRTSPVQQAPHQAGPTAPACAGALFGMNLESGLEVRPVTSPPDKPLSCQRLALCGPRITGLSLLAGCVLTP